MYECVFCTVQYLLVVVMYLEFLCNVGVVYFLFVYVLSMCGAKDIEVFYMTPNILVSCVCDMIVLFNIAFGLC